MSKCNFTIPIAGSVAETVGKARSGIEKQGGSFNGDELAGTFSVKVLGTISGSYNISGMSMNISIDSKPIIISCGQIESFMGNYIGS